MDAFGLRLLRWYKRHGRRHLPWQQPRSAYRVWVSEVMLQQTQVQTVVPYFQRFMTRFPDPAALAAAELDAVLNLWSGLGYYARARHLHAAARRICEAHGGVLPRTADALMALPGIGRSTAAAILALTEGRREAILDGNVKRVLARYHAIPGWPGHAAVADELWRLAERHTPARRVADYTQAIMDLGATLCTRRAPGCGRCPVRADCTAYRGGCVEAYPAPRPARTLPERETQVLMACNAAGEVLLERRAPAGIWGGLWSFPECEPGAAPERHALDALDCQTIAMERWPRLRHSFTHYTLVIAPVLLRVAEAGSRVMEHKDRLWYKGPDGGAALGMPAPVLKLLQRLSNRIEELNHSHDTPRPMRQARQRGRGPRRPTLPR
ncbi:MAG: A/G-specific adenine glycosylase [Gammaproteobacteria bacterium]